MGKMSDSDLADLVGRRRDAALAHVEGTPARDRREALQFYRGDNLSLYGNSGDGLSTIVSRDMMEAVESILPGLVKPFIAGEETVRFEPTGPEDEEGAKQATEYINYLFQNHNDAVRVIYDFTKDGLMFRLGVAKVVHEEVDESVLETYTGLGELELAALEADKDHEIVGDVMFDEQTGTFEVKCSKSVKRSMFRVYVISPDEFLFEPRLASMDEGRFFGHRATKPMGDFIAMGLPKKKLQELRTAGTTEDEDDRFEGEDDRDDGESDEDIARLITVDECYVRCDYDGTGVLGWRKVFMGADSKAILLNEEADDHPYETWTPIPLPHKLIGMGVYDLVRDLQMQGTALARESMNALYLANRPQREVVEGQVNFEDLLNPEVGGLVRVKQPGMVREIASGGEGVIQQSMAMMEQIAQMREQRTGSTRYNQGMDANSLNKMLCIETPVPMATGDYKRLADIEDDDWIIGSDGRPVRVIKSHRIHDPERAYRLTFASGENVDAGGEHLWTVQTDNDRKYGKSQTVDTDRLFEMMQGKGRIYIPRVERPQTGYETELPLDPYMLGTWLGDGHSYAPRITTMEAETVEYAAAWAEDHGGLTKDRHQRSGQAESFYVRGLYTPLREMKLLKRGEPAKDADIVGKHIPEEYFRASYRQRLELLRGLMDTDGCHHSRSLAIFCQKGGRLLDDTIRLIESLGGWPSVKKLGAEGRFDHSGDHYQVTFSLADCPFKLSRKAKGWLPPERNATTQIIKGIERIEIKPMRCLTVDAEDGLFCVGRRFTVTHNTATGISIIQNASTQRQELIARHLAEGIKGIFRKLLGLTARHSDKAQVIRLRGQWVEMDPSDWKTGYDMSVSVGLGTGNREQQIGRLMQMLEMDERIIGMQQGVNGPILTLPNIYEKLKRLVEAMGMKGVENYYTDPSVEEEQAQEPEGVDPIEEAKAEAMLQIEKEKIKAHANVEIAKIKAETDVIIAGMNRGLPAPIELTDGIPPVSPDNAIDADLGLMVPPEPEMMPDGPDFAPEVPIEAMIPPDELGGDMA
jgi:hypothetical protein